MKRTVLVMLLTTLLAACSQGVGRVGTENPSPYSGGFNNAMVDRCREQNFRGYNPITGNCE